MQYAIKRDCIHELAVQEAGHYLLEHLHQSIPPEVAYLPLGYQDDRLKHSLFVQSPIIERCLKNGDDLLLFGGIRVVVPSRSNQPLAEMLHLYTRQAA